MVQPVRISCSKVAAVAGLHTWTDEDTLQELFEQSVFITRLYVTRGIKLEPKDENGDHAPPPGCGHA